MPADLTGILCALLAAFTWGGGDFCGGAAARRSNLFQVITTAAFSGLILLAGFALLSGERFPDPAGMLWAALAGACGAAGMVLLYRALALGQAAMAAPTSAVVGAALPVLFTGITQGLPGPLRIAGFGLALAGIGLVSRPNGNGAFSRRALLSALLAGTGFAGFFILINQAGQEQVFTPLIISRLVTLCAGLLLLRVNRLTWTPRTVHPIGVAAGLLDAGGNLFFVLAGRFTRLDAASVVVSLYPAATVLLARAFWREDITRTQAAGVLLCLTAIVLIIL